MKNVICLLLGFALVIGLACVWRHGAAVPIADHVKVTQYMVATEGEHDVYIYVVTGEWVFDDPHKAKNLSNYLKKYVDKE